MRTLGVATALFFFAALSGCTRSVDDKSKVTIQLPSNSNSASFSNKIVVSNKPPVMPSLAGSKWGYSSPSVTSDYNCYAVAVSAPDLPYDIEWTTLSKNSGRVYTISGMFKAGATVDVEVPAGSSRTIGLIGFYVDQPQYCVDLGAKGQTLQAGHFSPPAWLAEATKDIAPSSDQITLTIPASISPSLVFEEAIEKPFASSTFVEATASGLPATGAVSNATAITFNVAGFNADQYYYIYTNDLTCLSVYPRATSFLQISAVPSITFGTAGLPDGPVAACVIGKSSAGVIQTVPTIYTWIKDFTAPTSLSLAVSTATNLQKPLITVSNAEIGSTINLYLTADCTGAIVGTGLAGATTTTIAPAAALADGSYFFTAKATDAAGNVSVCSTSVVTNVDTVAPNAPIPKKANVIAGTEEPAGIYSGLSPYFAWAPATDNVGGSGISHYEVGVGILAGYTNISSYWIPIGNVLNYTYVSAAGAVFINGYSYSFNIRAVDAAGNTSTINSSYWDAYIMYPTWYQQAYFKSGQPMSNDQLGSSVAIDGDRLVVGAPLEDSTSRGVYAVDQTDSSAPEAGAVYVYKRDVTGDWAFEAYIKPDNASSGQMFGHSVAISGDTIVVGAPAETASTSGVSLFGGTSSFTASTYGAVYTFKFNGTSWTQESYIKPLVPNSAAKFGYSVAIYKNTIVVGAPYNSSTYSGAGKAYIYSRSAGAWTEQKVLTESSPAAANRFGWSVSINEDKVAVSSYNLSTTTGAVEIFEGAGSTWSNTATIKSFNVRNGDDFGTSVSIYKDRLAVGAPGEQGANTSVQLSSPWMTSGSSTQRGAVFVYEKIGGIWKEAAYVKPSNSSSSQLFGKSVSLFEELLAVGAPMDNTDRGRVYTYKIDGNYYEQNFIALNQTKSSSFGSSVAISNSAIAIGAPIENSTLSGVVNSSSYTVNFSTPTNLGAAFVYEASKP